jgi:hypothetical protein
MDDMVIGFLELWVEENVKPVPAGKQQAEAEHLAAACISYAAKEDIAEDQLNEIAEEETGGYDLTVYMSNAIDKAATEDLDELTDEDEEDA